MGSLALLQSLKESVLAQANVKAIYGEPISAHEKTIIPVAKIMYGYGAGAGTGGVGEKKHTRRGRRWRRRRASGAGGRHRGEQPADPIRSDFGQAEIGRCCAGRN